jgi:hypothetical protein
MPTSVRSGLLLRSPENAAGTRSGTPYTRMSARSVVFSSACMMTPTPMFLGNMRTAFWRLLCGRYPTWLRLFGWRSIYIGTSSQT